MQARCRTTGPRDTASVVRVAIADRCAPLARRMARCRTYARLGGAAGFRLARAGQYRSDFGLQCRELLTEVGRERLGLCELLPLKVERLLILAAAVRTGGVRLVHSINGDPYSEER